MTGTCTCTMDVPRAINPQQVVRSLSLLNVSWNVAVASSRFSSRVSSGMADTNRSVKFSVVNVWTGGGSGVGLFDRNSSSAVRVAPPVIRMGVR